MRRTGRRRAVTRCVARRASFRVLPSATLALAGVPALVPLTSDILMSFSVRLRGPGASRGSRVPWPHALAHPRVRTLAFALPLAVAAACASTDHVVSPSASPEAVQAVAASSVVISQLYGGGGNSGATYKNDFIELYNPSTTAVSVSGWSVQYASATGTTWAVTTLSGSIPAGGFYLVQEGPGAAGTVDLPTPDANGTIMMAAGAAKVALVNTANALTGSCPTTSATVIDFVGYGSTANCFKGTGPTATLTNTTAAIRKSAGQQNTNDNAADFAVGAPTPRNSGVVTAPVGPITAVAVTPSPTSVVVGGTVQLSARGTDANGNVATTTFTWATSDANIATVDNAGLVRGVTVSATPATITATAANGVAGTASVTVTTAGTIASVTWNGTPTATTSMAAGFQTQLFTPTAKDATGAVVPANFTFEALDPSVGTILPVGNSAIITGVAGSTTNPRFRVTATPIGGGAPFATTTSPVTIETAVYADSASTFSDNAEFGRPTAASTSNLNDLLITRSTYTASYNASRGTPNWVSYELDQRQRSTGQDRCNCFTAEPLLPANLRIYTSDYTNGGYDRGHMTRSADRTVTNGENARTFYLSNVVPQIADLNQGVWATFENQLADSAAAGRAVYIITGPLYSPSVAPRYIKQDSGQTKIRIPDSTWKVAFIGPYAAGNPFRRGTIQSWDDLANTTVLAVNMPNVAGVRNDAPSKYYTTVDAIEASTGYDFLSLLPTAYQAAIEAGDHAPVPVLNGPTSGAEGQTLGFNAAGTLDPDAGDVLTYAWNFGDGTTATGASTTKTFADNGTYTVVLTVTDRFGFAVTRRQQVTVTNAAPVPVIGATTTTTLTTAQSYNPLARFTDAGANDGPWRAVVAWGDGTTLTATLTTQPTGAIRASKTYATPGTYTVRFTVTDKDGSSAFVEQTVTVVAPNS